MVLSSFHDYRKNRISKTLLVSSTSKPSRAFHFEDWRRDLKEYIQHWFVKQNGNNFCQYYYYYFTRHQNQSGLKSANAHPYSSVPGVLVGQWALLLIAIIIAMIVPLVPAIVQHNEDFLQGSIPCVKASPVGLSGFCSIISTMPATPFNSVSSQLPKDHGMGVVCCGFSYSTCSQEELAQWFDLLGDPEISSAGQSTVLITPRLWF